MNEKLKMEAAEALEASRDSDDCIDLERIPGELQKTPEFWLAAVEKWWGLGDVPEEFRTQEACLEAVRQDGEQLEFVPEKLMTEEMCLTAVKDSWKMMKFVPDRLKTEPVCLAAVSAGISRLLDWVPKNLKDQVKSKLNLNLMPAPEKHAKAEEKFEACVSYMYRDACNYKRGGCIVLPVAGGKKDAEALAFAMQDGGEDFIAEDLGVDSLRFGSGEDDHCWHELVDVEIRPAGESRLFGEKCSCPAESFEELAAAFVNADWNEFDLDEGYGGPGWKKPSAEEIQKCIADAREALREADGEDEGPRP